MRLGTIWKNFNAFFYDVEKLINWLILLIQHESLTNVKYDTN